MNVPNEPLRTASVDLEHHAGRPQVSVVLPSHNEIRLLATTVTNISAGLEARSISHEILIIENGSSDGTLRLARLLAIQMPKVRVLTLARGNYGAALRAGFEAARGEYVINFDVDYYDLAFVDSSLTAFEKDFDIVLASKRGVGSQDRRPIPRRILTAGFTTAMRALLDLDVSDAHGMKAMRRELIEPIVETCSMTGSLFDVELVVRATRLGLHVLEVPAVVRELRPARTSVVHRCAETSIGLLRLRMLIGSGHETDHDKQHRAARVSELVNSPKVKQVVEESTKRLYSLQRRRNSS